MATWTGSCLSWRLTCLETLLKPKKQMSLQPNTGQLTLYTSAGYCQAAVQNKHAAGCETSTVCCLILFLCQELC